MPGRSRWCGSSVALVQLNVKDAHSLHLETLAELGIPGLFLLLLATGVPLAAAARTREHPYVPVALAAFIAFVGHAALDWDWEMPAVTLCGLTFAGCLLAAGRSKSTPVVLGARARAVGVPALLIVSGFAFVAMTGNRALGQAERASDRADPVTVTRHARKAASWTPWSSEPLRLEADAALEQGLFARARRLYRQAIDKDPNNWELWLNLGLASNGAARGHALARARELNPLDPQLEQLRETGL